MNPAISRVNLNSENSAFFPANESVILATTFGCPHIAEAALPYNRAGFAAGHTVSIIVIVFITVTRMRDKVSRTGIIAIVTAAQGIVIVVAISAGLADPDKHFHLGFRNLRRN